MSKRTVTVIGPIRRREFRSFIDWLCEHRTLTIVEQCETIAQSLASDEKWIDRSDLVVVLQSFPTQYDQPSVDQLIGRTLFRRLICCYGPWCESDGRNRQIWPDAQRVPLRLARRMVDWEVTRMQSHETLLPTSSRDEVFAYRLGEPEEWSRTKDLEGRSGLVVSPDSALRQTIHQILISFGMTSTASDLLKQTVTQRYDYVIHDVDPWSPVVQKSVRRAVQAASHSTLIGVANMPDAGLQMEVQDEDHIQSIVPKLDLEDSLRWQMLQAPQETI